VSIAITDDPLPAEVPTGQVMDKRLKRIIIVVAAILAAEFVWLFGITPLLPLSVVEVSGIPGIDRAALLAQGGMSSRSSFVTVNAETVRKGLESFHLVESAQVLKQYPDTVRIFLEPRKIIAMSLAAVNGRTVPVYFDRHGVVVRIGNDGQDPAFSAAIPIISGLVFAEPVLGMRLPSMFEPFLDRLARINAVTPELLTAISELRVNRKTYDGFDLILYPVHSPIKFRVESDLDEDILRYLILMIDVFASKGSAVEEVDLRTGAASYMEKEASSG
jgi:cell division protein FtsQ